jgi:hypothetical protein
MGYYDSQDVLYTMCSCTDILCKNLYGMLRIVKHLEVAQAENTLLKNENFRK